MFQIRGYWLLMSPNKGETAVQSYHGSGTCPPSAKLDDSLINFARVRLRALSAHPTCIKPFCGVLSSECGTCHLRLRTIPHANFTLPASSAFHRTW